MNPPGNLDPRQWEGFLQHNPPTYPRVAGVREKDGVLSFMVSCPWHDDEHPSCRITARWDGSQGVYVLDRAYCFACGARRYFDREGRGHPRRPREARATPQPRKWAFPLPMDARVQEYMDRLTRALLNHTPAMTWLREKRGLGGEAVRRFRLGYLGPDLPDDVRLNPISQVFPEVAFGEHRVLIPFVAVPGILEGNREEKGHHRGALLTGFSGRRVPVAGGEERTGKYIDYGRCTLYIPFPLLPLLDHIGRPGGPALVVVEGPFDAITLSRFAPEILPVAASGGVDNVPLTLLVRARKVYVFPDGDEAGRRAALRLLDRMASRLPNEVLERLWPAGGLQVLFLGEGEDPDVWGRRVPTGTPWDEALGSLTCFTPGDAVTHLIPHVGDEVARMQGLLRLPQGWLPDEARRHLHRDPRAVLRMNPRHRLPAEVQDFLQRLDLPWDLFVALWPDPWPWLKACQTVLPHTAWDEDAFRQARTAWRREFPVPPGQYPLDNASRNRLAYWWVARAHVDSQEREAALQRLIQAFQEA